MKLTTLGTVFRIFAVLLTLLSIIFTSLVFMDLPNLLGNPSQLVSTSEEMGITNETQVEVIRENGTITEWQLNLGNVSIHNTGEHIEIRDLRLNVEMFNKTSDVVFIDITNRKNVRIKPGETANLSILFRFYRAGLLKVSDFLYRNFRKVLYQAVNDALNTTYDEATWNRSVLNTTVFNKALLDQVILNGSLMEGSMDIGMEELIDESAFNDSLVESYGLTQQNVTTLYNNINDTYISNNLATIDDFFNRMLDQVTINGNITVFIGIMNIPLSGITVKLDKATIMDMFEGGSQ